MIPEQKRQCRRRTRQDLILVALCIIIPVCAGYLANYLMPPAGL